MRTKVASKDPDIRGSLPAMRRAAKKARELSIATGTPFYVWKDGRAVDLNAKSKRRRRSTSK